MRLRRKRNERPQVTNGEVLVRVAPEILALLRDGDPSPVVILGVNDVGDGTHEMVLRSVEQRPSMRLSTPSFGSVSRC